ncbi:MAG TPA: RNA polymerase sigma-70 factor [Ginsengibacter sp.]
MVSGFTTLYHEKELFSLIAEGDEKAFEELFHLYVPKIQPVIKKMVSSETIAEDIIQDIFLNIWVNRERLTEIESPSNWIFKIVYNRSYTWLRHQSVRSKASVRIIGEQPDLSHTNFTEENVLFSETARIVKEAIHQLPPKTKKIYELSREAGLKNPEIAAKLDISVQTVKNTLANAGKSVKTYLAGKGIIIPMILIAYYLQ